jgi:hypothetical protein
MPRISCRIPSTGRAINLLLANVPTTFTTIADAPDFSVPDTSLAFAVRDPLDGTRAVRPGEIFLLTPLAVANKTDTPRWVEVIILSEAGVTINSPGRVIVPARDTAFISVQGRSLLKRSLGTANGDRLRIRAETANTFDVWGSAEERLSSEHIG